MTSLITEEVYSYDTSYPTIKNRVLGRHICQILLIDVLFHLEMMERKPHLHWSQLGPRDLISIMGCDVKGNSGALGGQETHGAQMFRKIWKREFGGIHRGTRAFFLLPALSPQAYSN